MGITPHRDNIVRIWDVASRRCTGSFVGRGGSILPDNSRVLIFDTSLQLWDIASHECVAVFGEGSRYAYAETSFDGTIALTGSLASGGGGWHAAVWDLQVHTVVKQFPPGHWRFGVVSFSSDASLIATDDGDSVKCWSMRSEDCLWNADGGWVSLAFSHDDKVIVVA